jgi:hypothetical protein
MHMEKLRFWHGIVLISKVMCLFVNCPAITSNTSSNKPLRLNCFIFGGTDPVVQNFFAVNIARDKTVGDLKEAIKAKESRISKPFTIAMPIS